ncbi:hypothetical protein HNQ91_000346 [Filimonas zeae]|uniref:Uncharacterized protein n=1 Tax=Filimonas zeae TaxID=1737353 RepID=A0A917MQI2_9BACT|nr:hypothetical protein [Filimonas zeae]MDR6337324.1 hypothetical protein [Filimonas zeae]GGH58055.1 hypothetical protein GCM10011379_03400 [Filimonas zeae]
MSTPSPKQAGPTNAGNKATQQAVQPDADKNATKQALEQAENDMEQDPDMDIAGEEDDLDEGELARKDNSND